MEASVRDTIRELAIVNNLRQRITRLKLEGEELAKYGPAKQPDKQGIDQYSEEPIDKGTHYLQDPTGRRTGNGVFHGRPVHFDDSRTDRALHYAPMHCMACMSSGPGNLAESEAQIPYILYRLPICAACSPDVAKVLLKTLEEAAALASKVRPVYPLMR